MIETPEDARVPLAWADPGRCKEESPCWGYEGEGEQCLRRVDHDGPHHTMGRDYRTADGHVVIQWEIRP